MSEVVLTRDLSSGRIHRRYLMPGGQLASFEGCNLDDAGDYERITDTQASDAEPDALCRNCFSTTVLTATNDGTTV